MGQPSNFANGSEAEAAARARSFAASAPARSPHRLVAAGMVGVMLLATFFMTGTFTAITFIDDSSVRAELDRARTALAITSDPERLSADFALRGARVATAESLLPQEVYLPLPGGTDVVAWIPRRFASEAFPTVAPPRLFFATLVIACVAFILLRLNALARDLEIRRRLAHEMASRDPLTGLRNRLTFDHELRSAFTGTGPRGHGLALLYLDLDGFKAVNDTLGHLAGDELLRTVGERLTLSVAATDTVARLGGDEFAIIRRGSTNRGDLAGLALQIDRALTAPYDLEGAEATVGVSIGIARAPRDALSAGELVRAADAALYRAKAEGGSLFAFAESTDEAFRIDRGHQRAA